MARKPVLPALSVDNVKAHLDALNTTLLVPLPVLLIVGVAIAARAPDVTVFDLKLQLALANLVKIAVIGYALLNTARHTSALATIYRASGQDPQVRLAIESHVGALNPFATITPLTPSLGERLLTIVLHATPLIAVGLLIGLALGFNPAAPFDAVMRVPEFLAAAFVAAPLFVAGTFGAIVTITHLLLEFRRCWAASLFWLAVIAGFTVGALMGIKFERLAAEAPVVSTQPSGVLP